MIDIPHPIPVGVKRATKRSQRLADEWGFFAVVVGAMTLSTALLTILAIVIVVTTAGCTPQQIAADEAAVHDALVKLESGVDWAASDPVAAKALVAQTLALDPSNKTLQAVAAKTTAAIDAGALPVARLAVVGGIALTQPTAAK